MLQKDLNRNTNIKLNFRTFLKGQIKEVRSDKFFHLTFLIIFLKSLIFIGIISVDNGASISFTHAFYSIPPILIYFSFITIFLSFSYLFKKRNHLFFLLFINFFISFIYIFDLWYFRGYRSFLSLHLLKQTSNLDNLLLSVLSMWRNVDILFLVDLIPLCIFTFKNKNLYKHAKSSVFLWFLLFSTSVTYIFYAHYKVDILGKGYKSQILFKESWTPNITISSLTPIGYHIFDIYKFYKDSKPYILSQAEKSEIKNYLNNNKENLPDNKFKGILKGKNLLIIQVESLENFVINEKINGEEITPNLNKLLNNSLYFNNYYEQVYNGSSSDADFMTNTSLYPTRSGSTFFRFTYNKYNSLPILLKAEGYNTLAAHPDKGTYWNWMPSLYSIGFEKCIDSSFFKSDEIIGLGLSDESYLKQLAPVITSEKQPFYTFLVTLTSHGPFNLPNDYRELPLSKDFNKNILGGYLQSIHYTDKQIGVLLDTLKKSNVLKDTVVVIYGDHCGVHKYYEDEAKKVTEAPSAWNKNNKRIPLIIYNSEIKGEKISTFGGQVDLMPTLSYLLDIPKGKYENTILGKNLLNTKKNYVVLSDKTILGTFNNNEDKENYIKGIDISDLILKSNYFNGGN